ncbi:MAG: hypothetical protein K6T78_15885 [Alicyclobacillus sp.]|nr:hypothetical protein [Alicyclobacillus sp.]
MAVPEHALQVVDTPMSLAMPVDPAQAAMMYQRLRDITKKVLIEGVDYGRIPGAPKPTLYKSGAENLLRFYGLGHKIILCEKTEDWENGFFEYTYRVRVFRPMPDGTEITLSECDGSANVREPKFARKKDGTLRDPYEQVNSLKKMALKRALVGAALQATGGSGLFTQDIEDMTDIITDAPQEPSASRSTAPSGGAAATDKQLGLLSKKAKAKGLDAAALDAWAVEQVGKHVDQLTKKEASQLIDALDHYQPTPKGGPPDDDPFDGDALDIDDADLPF